MSCKCTEFAIACNFVYQPQDQRLQHGDHTQLNDPANHEFSFDAFLPRALSPPPQFTTKDRPASTVLLNKDFRKYTAMVSFPLFCSPRIDIRIHTNKGRARGDTDKPVRSWRGSHIEINETTAAIATCAVVHCASRVFFVPLPLLPTKFLLRNWCPINAAAWCSNIRRVCSMELGKNKHDNGLGSPFPHTSSLKRNHSVARHTKKGQLRQLRLSQCNTSSSKRLMNKLR